MNRLPLFHDDHSFREQTERMFREMEEKMGFNDPHNPVVNPSFHELMTSRGRPPSWPTSTTNTSSSSSSVAGVGRGPLWHPSTAFDDKMFFQLRPAAQLHQDLTSGVGLQSEVLDDDTTRALFVDVDPHKGQGHGRVFRMSFDAREYDPADVSVRSEDGCLIVDAQHVQQDSSGSKVSRQFQRRIQLPRDVDPTKLTSTLSNDGILTVHAPVPPRYHAIVGQSADSTLLPASSVPARSSPVTVRLDPAGNSSSGRSRSPCPPGGQRTDLISPGLSGSSVSGRRSPLLGATGAFMPITTTLRTSPLPFGTFTPVTVVNASQPQQTNVDTPIITTDPQTGRRRLELVLELGRPYTADDVVVTVDGRRVKVDAKHETTDQHGRVATSSTQKQFDISEHVDETTVEARLREDGRMIITGFVKQ